MPDGTSSYALLGTGNNFTDANGTTNGFTYEVDKLGPTSYPYVIQGSNTINDASLAYFTAIMFKSGSFPNSRYYFAYHSYDELLDDIKRDRQQGDPKYRVDCDPITVTAYAKGSTTYFNAVLHNLVADCPQSVVLKYIQEADWDSRVDIKLKGANHYVITQISGYGDKRSSLWCSCRG